MQFAEGTVTAINQNLMFYEINEIIRVYTVFSYSEENPFHLIPNLGASVTINPILVQRNHLKLKRHLKFEKRIIILNPKDVVQCSSSNLIPVQNSRLFNFIQRTPLCTSKRSICACDIETINKMYDLLEAHTGRLLTNPEVFLFQILQVLQRKYSQEKQIFHTFKLNFLDEINYIHEMNNYVNENWTFATCSSRTLRVDEFLFGYLYVDRSTGMPFLSDGKTAISCTGYGEYGSRNLFDYINKFLLIKEYTMVYEFYKEKEDGSDVVTSEHILFKLNSVICLRLGPDKCSELRKLSNCSSGLNCSNAISIQIQAVSLPILNDRKEIEVWLEIKQNLQTKYLRLEADFYRIFPLLKPHCSYEVYPTRQLFKAYHVEIYKLNTKAIRQGLPTQSVFGLINDNNFVFNYQNLESAEKCLKSSKPGEMISFRGKLARKLFMPPLPHMTFQEKKANFGTPGSQIHVLEFQTATSRLKLFLYDWESRPTPHCLIPNMVLIVHNVLVHNGNYFKSCYMTMFEVVAYEPPVGFQAANFFFANSWNFRYGSSCILSCLKVPCNVIVSSKVNILKFVHVTIRPASNLTSLLVELRLVAIGKLGCVSIVVNEDYGSTLLKKLIQLPEHNFVQFCKSFVKFGQFDYPIYNKQKPFHVLLATHLKVLEELKTQIDIKCIKVSEEQPTEYKLLAAQIH